jgi:hypothetical protein
MICQVDGKLSKNIVSNLVQKYELNKAVVESCFIHHKKEDFMLSLCNPLSDKSIGTTESN